VKETKESPSKIKALNDTILRMNEKNVRLTTENKSLKEDMDKLLNEVSDKREKESKGFFYCSTRALGQPI